MGVVYEAIQVGLKRRVALKMILAGRFARATDRARLRIEAEASARLDHPNIVQIHEVGEHDGYPFLALEFIDGGSLAERLRTGRFPDAQAAALVERLARAVHHAHQRGIIHRDLKPSNVLLQGTEPDAEFDGLVPKICDFGLARLARLARDGADLTLSGSVLGTPAYMAPEQAAGRAVSTAADVYALGAILYELLTGRPPFRGDTVEAVLRMVQTEAPERPSRVRPEVAADLEAICSKCLEREPGDRYASAGELAEDLRRFLGDEPVRARPARRLRRAWKWTRRNPTRAALLLVLALSCSGFIGGTLWHQYRLESALTETARERDRASDARREAEEQRDAAFHNAYQGQIPLAQRAWETAHIDRLNELLDDLRPRAGQTDPRNVEWYYLDRLRRAGADTFVLDVTATALAFAPNGRMLATACADGTVRLWDPATGTAPLPSLKMHTDKATAVAFSPDGELLVSAGGDKRIFLWNIRTGELVRRFDGHTDWVYHVAFDRSGRRLASASADQTVRLWDVESGREIRAPLTGNAKQVTWVAFSPDGRYLASAGADRKARVWDLQNPARPREFGGHGGWVYSAVFRPDGNALATAGFDGVIRIWDLRRDDAPVELRGHADQIRGLAYAADGSRLASAGYDRTVRIWDADSGEQLFCFKGHRGRVQTVAFRPDGTGLASGGEDRAVRFWPADRHQEFVSAPTHASGSVYAVAFSPDGTRLVSGGSDATVRLWGVPGGQQHTLATGLPGAVRCLSFSPSGTLVAVGAGKQLTLWEVETTRLARHLEGHTDRVSAVSFSPNGRALASASFDGHVRVWNVVTGEKVADYKAHQGRVLAVAFSPDGTVLASAGEDKLVRVWNVATAQELVVREEHRGWVYCLAFSPDGQFLASGGEDGTIRLWYTATWASVRALEGHSGRVNGVCFTSDNKRLLSVGHFDRTMRLWELTRGQELLTLSHSWPVHAVAIDPKGRMIVTAGEHRSGQIWNTAPIGN
jgi:WD40 repeat protein/tRNA A-37 threonylcarbamoyl transferase component Bud32